MSKTISKQKILSAFVACAIAITGMQPVSVDAQTYRSSRQTDPRQGMNQQTIDLMDGIFNKRQPLTTIDGFLNIPTYRKAVGNDDDIVTAFNTIITKKYGTFTPEEMQTIENGFHLEQIAGQILPYGPRGHVRAEVSELYQNVFYGIGFWSILLSPNERATQQILNMYSNYLGRDVVEEYDMYGFLNRQCDTLKSKGFQCRTYAAYTPVDVSQKSDAPSEATLAKMSQYVYELGKTGAVPEPIDGFEFMGSSSNISQGFGAMLFKRGNKVVLAIRGTEPDRKSSIAHQNWLADMSVTGSSPNQALKDDVRQAATALLATKMRFPQADIYLTGHSLGGAVVQILASGTQLPTAAFNAPGSAEVVGQLSKELTSLGAIPFNKGNDINYRMYGDPISVFGTPVASICTIWQPSVSLAPLDNHAIDLMVKQISQPSTPRAPISVSLLYGNTEGFPRGLKCPSP